MRRRAERWYRRDRTHAPEALASVLALRGRHLAIGLARELDGGDPPAGQWLDGIEEALAWLAHVADRLAAARLPADGRERLVVALARRLADMVEENRAELGLRERRDFIARFNRRSAEYAGLSFDAADGGYALMRAFAHNLAGTLPPDQRVWAVQQTVEILAPAAYARFARSAAELLVVDSEA